MNCTSTTAVRSITRISVQNSRQLGHPAARVSFVQQRHRRNMASTASIASVKQNCKKVVCIGRNYADHIAELSSARPKQPFFFQKPRTTIHLPSDGPVIRPKGVDLHYEIELAVIIGKTIKNLQESDTQAVDDSIAAYALSIDMTARNVQWEAKKKGLPWDISKGFDTFLPISDVIPKSRIKDPYNLTIELSVNGKIHQRDNTNLMLFQLPRILSDISKVMTLEAGDIVITGTPKGVGPVVPGEVMVGRLEDENGEEIKEARIEVGVAESTSTYEYAET